jgi:hypothetical protein
METAWIETASLGSSEHVLVPERKSPSPSWSQ